MSSSTELRLAAFELLAQCDVAAKTAGVQRLAQAWQADALCLDTGTQLVGRPELLTCAIPGRPDWPELVSPQHVKRRAMHTPEGRATLIHALAHIEFNAINLALDAIWRYAGLPAVYYADWLQVAAEEAQHFSMLEQHLQSLGYRYGDFPAHNGLWEMAEKTRDDLLARLALVPRTLEARGLDVTPAMRAKLTQAGDHAAAAMLDVILRDEIGHVAIGNRWYHWSCAQRKLDPIATYASLIAQYRAPAMHAPFNIAARRQAGFSEAELESLAG